MNKISFLGGIVFIGNNAIYVRNYILILTLWPPIIRKKELREQ